MLTQVERQYLVEVGRDRDKVLEWLQEGVDTASQAIREATEVRRVARSLERLRAGDAVGREELERTLAALDRGLRRHKLLTAAERPYIFLRHLSSFDVVGREQLLTRDSVAAAPAVRSELDALRVALDLRLDEHDRFVADAETAISQAHIATRSALVRSGAALSSSTWQPSRGVVPSLLPFAAFLSVAVVGSFVPPSTLAINASIAVLIGSVAVAVVRAVLDKARAGAIAALATGSSLAFFTAAYLACEAIDPSTIASSDSIHPIGAIGEFALLSLSVGVTVGPIGVVLSGLARGFAFLQLLFTLAAVGTALTWGWARLMDWQRERTDPNEQ